MSEAKALAQAHNLNIEITGNDLSSGNVKAYRQSEKQGSMVAQGKWSLYRSKIQSPF